MANGGVHRKRFGKSRPYRSSHSACDRFWRTTQRSLTSRSSVVGSTTSVLRIVRSSSKMVRGLRPSLARCCHYSKVFQRTEAKKQTRMWAWTRSAR